MAASEDFEELKRRINAYELSETSLGLKEKVQALLSVLEKVWAIGRSLVPGASAKQRILSYLMANVRQPVNGNELQVVAGISEYQRRTRELRVQEGYPIVTGTLLTKRQDVESLLEELGLNEPLRPDQYILLDLEPDHEAAKRWRLANKIRRSEGSIQQKLLKFFLENVGKPVFLDELRYVAGDSSEWARRVRELRTEEGWPILSPLTGDRDLPAGSYMLVSTRQEEPHDRIPELTRKEVLRRDNYQCQWLDCGYPEGFPRSDRRWLEVHHLTPHVQRGSNDPDNLVTLCNLHHDLVHKTGRLEVGTGRKLPTGDGPTLGKSPDKQ